MRTPSPTAARGRAVALGLAAALVVPGAAAPAPAPALRVAAEPAIELRSALVARGATQAFVVVRLTGDLPRGEDDEVRASVRVGRGPAGRVRPLDRVSFRHYCFRAHLRRPWPAVGRRVGIALRSPALPRALRTTRVVVRARPGDGIGARLGCRLPTGGGAGSPRAPATATAGRP